MRPRLFSLLGLLVCLTSADAKVEAVAPERRRALPRIHWTDENGRDRELGEFAGFPVVILPIYTRCRGACVQDVARLKEGLATAKMDPRLFRVLLFSFDPTDTPAALQKFREREQIPLNWATGTAAQPQINALLDSLGLQVGKAGAEFTHPNVVFFLDAKLSIAKWIYGTAYSPASVDAALGVASGRSDWIGRHADVLYALSIFVAVLLCVALVQQLLSYGAASREAAAVVLRKS